MTLIRASDVMVYAIGFLQNQSSGSRSEQRLRLTQMATESGGSAFFPTTMKEIEEAYDTIVSQVRAQYTLGYVSTNTATDGHWRKVEIRVRQPLPTAPASRPGRATSRRTARINWIRGWWMVFPGSGYHAPTSLWTRTLWMGDSGELRDARFWALRTIDPESLSTDHHPPPAHMPSVHDRFKLVSDFEVRGDQVHAVPELVEGLNRGDSHQVLLGVTGSGKTFTMAQVLAHVNRPTLVMAHNKTLAAQLYQEFKRFFPENAVEYFVSYYDYYQPEAYVPATDSYIEKEATINDEIDRMRLSATRSLFERRDVIIVASVSCIYGLGSPEAYYGLLLPLELGQRIDRDQILRKLVEIQYERNDTEFGRGTFRVRGDIVEVVPSYEEHALRIGLFGDEVDELAWFDPLTGKVIRRLDKIAVYPKSHFVTSRDRTKLAVESIKRELEEHRGCSNRKASCSRRSGCTSGRCSTSR